ncbi:MAG: hypothetical protein ACQXXF_06195 [Thermoplasmatota archaeon]
METFVDVYMNADGEKGSVIFSKLIKLGLKYYLGEHDFVYDWKGIATIQDELELIDKIQSNLKGTGALLKFTTIR